MSIKLQVDNKEIAVTFSYTRETVPANPNKEKSRAYTKPVATQCMLMEGDSVIASGQAFCHVNDRFSYRKGRKWSLKFAMEDAGYDKVTRTVIWEQVMDYIRG